MAWLPFGQLPLECGEGFDGLSQTGRPAAPGLPAANRLAPVDEVQWFENHMRSAMPKALATLAGQAFAVRCLELVPDIAIRCQCKPLFRHCPTTDVAAKPFRLLAFLRLGGHARMQGESGCLAHRVIERLITGRQGLQREDFAALLRTYGDTVGNGMPQQQPYSYIALEPTLLGLPALGHPTTRLASSSLPHDGLSTDFVGSFKQVMLSYVQETDLNIEFAAGLCDMSRRSLQRRLSAAGTHYSEVLDQVRFEAATRMLHDPGKSVTEVALLLGYSDLTHFSRAFRRIAGVSPRTYRQAYVN